MQFNVPQFIEREAKIFGPFTFKQFIFIVIAGAISIFFYFTIKPKSFFLFLLLTVLTMGIAFGLAFLKPGGIPLPTALKNFFLFSFKPKIYLWQKKAFSVKIPKKEVQPKKEVKEEPALKMIEKSYLRDLFTRLETKTK